MPQNGLVQAQNDRVTVLIIANSRGDYRHVNFLFSTTLMIVQCFFVTQIYRVFQNKLHKVCHVINFEPFVLCPIHTADADATQLSS